MTPEQEATLEVRTCASSRNLRVFRNNNGVASVPGKRPVRFGLGNESEEFNSQYKFGDLIGITPIVITEDMVGKTVGVFTNLEVKPKGELESTKRKALNKVGSREWAQKNAIDFVELFGGMAGFVTCEEDLDKLLSEFFRKLKT